MEGRNVYLDHNATTPLHPEVREEMVKSFEYFGNPSSLHTPGRKARIAVDEARERIAGFIGADKPGEVYFTSCGSEGNNTVLNNALDRVLSDSTKRSEFVTTEIEHPCITKSIDHIIAGGMFVKSCPVDGKTRVDKEIFEEIISSDVYMVSVMSANNETGTIQDIGHFSKRAHEYGALFHTDAVQALGKIPFNVKECDLDYATFSAHKIYGPKGVGALYVKEGVPAIPFILGGHQERSKRAGTENISGILGFAKAVEMREKEMEEEAERLNQIKEWFKRELSSGIDRISFNGDQEFSLPGTLNVSFEGAEGEALLLYLDFTGISVSTGSACASGSLSPSYVLTASGLSPELAHGSVRFSMGRDTTKDDMEYTVERLTELVEKIRSISSIN
ncbi:MAG: cysteine desulfurase family protein [Chitinivibrionales bacterium]